MELKYAVMTDEKTKKTSNPQEVRTPEEVTEYNDQVWDMVLRKVHVVAFYVLLQIVLVSMFQTHPVYERWSLGIYIAQFFGAWTVFYGTLLRDMGFRSFSGAVLIVLAFLALLVCALSDPLAWTDRSMSQLLLTQVIPVAVLWCLTFYRWRVLKRQFLAAQAKGMIS